MRSGPPLTFSTRIIGQAELALSAVLTAAVLILLCIRATHAGPLWRDEAAALHLAQLPSLSEVARNFQHEAFPLLFPLSLRAYSDLFGASDPALRIFGLIVGVGFVGTAWFTMPRGEKPLLQLGLVGFNTTFLIWGTTVRGYGVGSLLILLTFAFAARALRRTTAPLIVSAIAAAVASTQYLLHNLILIGAMGLAAAALLLIRNRSKEALVPCAMAVLCALTVLPYAPNYLGAGWRMVLRVPVGFGWLWREFLSATGEPWWLMRPLWLAVAILFVAAVVTARRARKEPRPRDTATIYFASLFILLAIPAYFGFLRVLSYATHAWYYLALVTVLAGATDLCTAIHGAAWFRIGRLTIAAISLCSIPTGVLRAVMEPQSNMNDVAAHLSSAKTGDLIVLNPWFLAPSFERYYHGFVPLVTVPSITDHRFHRFDLIQAKMRELQPLAGVEQKIRETLISGGNVWLVGGALMLPNGALPRKLAPAPDPEFGWSTDAYTTSWSEEIGAFLQAHTANATVALAPEIGVNSYENIPLWVAKGWRD